MLLLRYGGGQMNNTGIGSFNIGSELSEIRKMIDLIDGVDR